MRHEKSGDDADGQQGTAEPEQPLHRDQQLAHRRQIPEQPALQVVLLELAVQHQEHHPGDRRKGQGTVSEDGHGGVRFMPRVHAGKLHGISRQHARNER